MTDVAFKQVSKVYPNNVTAVNRVDLHVRDGEFMVLVGPSGCGKSTLLRMLAGLEEVTIGEIRIGERRVNDVAPKDRDIAMVFQNYALYPHMTVRMNLAFGLKLRKTPKQEINQRIMDAARLLDIDHLLDRKPKALSGGQRQRVAVGRAIVRNPSAFLFDEPLSNLDAKLRIEMRSELKRLHRRLAVTTLYVTHDQEEAMTLGDRVVVINQGCIQQCDSPLNVYHAPANRFVAGFLGTPSMNFVEGELSRREGGVWFNGGDVSFALCARHAERVASRVDTRVILGARPEALHLSADADHRDDMMLIGPVEVDLVEPLGAAVDVAMHTTGEQRLAARINAEQWTRQSGDPTLYLDREKIHLFDPDDPGVNLTLEQVAPTSPSA